MTRTHEQMFRRFLILMSGLAFIGTVVELWFLEHKESFVQLLPFFLCGIGLLMLSLTHYVPGKGILHGHRIVMSVIALSGFFGIYQHLKHNFAFELEIRPNAAAADVFWDALSGASPLLAPGILTFAAVLALAATWKK